MFENTMKIQITTNFHLSYTWIMSFDCILSSVPLFMLYHPQQIQIVLHEIINAAE